MLQLNEPLSEDDRPPNGVCSYDCFSSCVTLGLSIAGVILYFLHAHDSCDSIHHSHIYLSLDFWLLLSCGTSLVSSILVCVFIRLIFVYPRTSRSLMLIIIFSHTIFSLGWFAYGWWLWIRDEACQREMLGYLVFGKLVIDALMLLCSCGSALCSQKSSQSARTSSTPGY